MDALRASLSILCLEQDDSLTQAAAVTAATAVIAAARARSGRGLPALAPDPPRDHAAEYLRTVRRVDDHPSARALGRFLVTPSPHYVYALTFSPRVVTSSGSEIVSAL